MKFQELNPIISETDIRFDCPKCGPPHTIWIAARFNQPPFPGVWSWTHDGESVTISPPIHNHIHAGRIHCGAHIAVTNGEVIVS